MTAAAPGAAAVRDRADRMGMLLFLTSEVMLFGGLVALLLALRLSHPAEVAAASRRLHLWIGTGNTAVLLTSSLLVAKAVEAVRDGRGRPRRSLAAAALLGLAFLSLKALEYKLESGEGLLPGLSPRPAFSSDAHHLFMNLYLIATGLHAVHLTIGVALLVAAAVWTVPRGRRRGLEAIGLYWHLVDAIWVVLFPLLYLSR